MVQNTEIVISRSSRIVKQMPGRIFLKSEEILPMFKDEIRAAGRIIFASYSRELFGEKQNILLDVAKFLVDEGVDQRTVFLSSDYVFSGLRGKYTVDDEVDPTSEYGAAKVQLEGLLANSLIVRFTTIGPSVSRSPLLLDRIYDGERLILYPNQVFSPVSTEVVNSFIGKERGVKRLVHLAGERLSKADVIQRYHANPNALPIDMSISDHSLLAGEK